MAENEQKNAFAHLAAAKRELGQNERLVQETDLGGHWDYYDSNLLSYENYFRDVLPREEYSLQSYLRRILGSKSGSALGIDIGGPGSRLFNDLQGVVAESAGVVMRDWRKHNPPPKLVAEMSAKGMDPAVTQAMD